MFKIRTKEADYLLDEKQVFLVIVQNGNNKVKIEFESLDKAEEVYQLIRKTAMQVEDE